MCPISHKGSIPQGLDCFGKPLVCKNCFPVTHHYYYYYHYHYHYYYYYYYYHYHYQYYYYVYYY